MQPAVYQHNSNWQQLLANGVSCPKQLLQLLGINLSTLEQPYLLDTPFKTRVPKGFIERMQTGNAHDPLLRQVLPTVAELNELPGYSADPVAEQQANPTAGILQKYHGRVLLILAGGCAINCRYCFRRHFPYAANLTGRNHWNTMLNYIRNDISISEVIYSGGDPLLLDDIQLTELTQQIAEIPHVRLLRIHSRMPIVLPERITTDFLAMLDNTRLQTVLALHCNHPNELNHSVHTAIQALRSANTTVLNQSVLLTGVNDHAESLIALSRTLFEYGALPYYLNILDKVQGAAHFAVSKEKITHIYQQMLKQLPGYLVPKLVQEKANVPYKLPVTVPTG